MLLSVAYLPPVEYFALLAKYSSVNVEACENYRRQTWRNRCRILTASGPEDLRFPVVHGGGRLISEVRVDYGTPWVAKTEQALDTAYYSSPFYEYYRDGLFGILDSKPETVWELDMRLTRWLALKLGLATELVPTSEFVPPRPDDELDVRYSLSPKIPSSYAGRPYWQVFREKFGFVGGLSAVDLLFNEGPEAAGYLR